MPYAKLRTSPSALAELIPSFRHQLQHCALGADERLVVVTDPSFDPHYAAACAAAATDLGVEAFQAVVSSHRPTSDELLRALFQAADLIVYASSQTLHYRSVMREALDAGKRALMVAVPRHVLERRLADPRLKDMTTYGAGVLDRASEMRILSDAGTELSMSVNGRRGVASYGYADTPGHLDFWGAGFFQIAVVEGSMEGRLVLDTGDLIFHWGRYVDRPLTIELQDGKAVAFHGGVEASLIEEHLRAAGEPSAFMAGHIACGTDREARWTVETTQFPDSGGGGADAESYYGNVQVELGSNDDVLFGGKNRSSVHLGMCCRNASLFVDGEPLLEGGEFRHDRLR